MGIESWRWWRRTPRVRSFLLVNLESEPTFVTNEETVSLELAALLTRDPSEAFVIFLERTTEKFVQFSGGLGSGLFLDLPCQPLSEVEFHRAVALFREHGQELHESDLLDTPGGVPVRRQFSFRMDLGNDVTAATRLAIDVFSRVYEFPADFSLVVDRC